MVCVCMAVPGSADRLLAVSGGPKPSLGQSNLAWCAAQRSVVQCEGAVTRGTGAFLHSDLWPLAVPSAQ